jgi:hypothetical protein
LEIVICQNCGNILKTRARTCESCNGLVSRFGSTPLPSFPQSAQALSVDIRPDPQVLERVLVKRVGQAGGPDPEMVNAFLSRVFNIVGAPQMPVGNFVGNGENNGNGGLSGYDQVQEQGFNGAAQNINNYSQEAVPGANSNGSYGQHDGSNGQAQANETSAGKAYGQAQSVEVYTTSPEFDPVGGLGQGLPPEPIPGTIVDYPPPQKETTTDETREGETAREETDSSQRDSGNYPEREAISADAAAFAGDQQASPSAQLANQYIAQYQEQRQSGSFETPQPAQNGPQAGPSDPIVGEDRSVPAAPPTTPVAVPPPAQPLQAEQDQVYARASVADQASISANSTGSPVLAGSPPPVVSVNQDFFADSPPPPVASELSAANRPVQFVEDEPPPDIKPKLTLEQEDFFASAPVLKRTADQSGPSTKVVGAKSSGSFEAARHADADDDEIPVKVSAPLGYKKREQSDRDFETHEKPLKDEDRPHKEKESHPDQDGVHYDDEEHDLPPARRSFSGKSGIRPTESKVSAAKAKKPIKTRDEDDDDDDDASEKARRDHGTVSVMGLSVSKMQAGIAICAVLVLLFVCFQIFSTVFTTMFAGATTGQLGNPFGGGGQDNLSGKWRFAAKAGNVAANGTMLLRQQGNRVYGEGQDNSGGYFRFDGTYNGTVLEFTKQYYRGQGPFDKPITFHARVKPDGATLFAQGDWSKTYGEGAGWRHQVKTMTGLWEADRIEAGVKDAPGVQAPSAIAQKEPMSTLGLKMAAFFIAIAIGVFVFARRFFGPDGWNNQRQKQKYIPSQYLGENRKEIRELGQPLKAGSVPFGRRCEWRPWLPWETKDIALPPQARVNNPHILLLGAGDKGKSRLIAKMVTHDIEAGDRAVVLIDSDGELSELVVDWAAAHPNGKEIAKRVVIVDPTWPQGSLAYNPLEMPEDGDLQSAASSMVNGFKAIYTEPPGSQSQWNQQTANILRNATLLLMVNKKTLTDLPTLLQENDFRDVLLEGLEAKRKEKVEYGTLLETWGQYKRLARTDQWINWVEPILNRTTPMLSDPRIRPILTKDKGDISLTEIIKKKKILIVRIPQGQLDKNANLLGSLLVTGLKQAALTIATVDRSNERSGSRPVALYLDEFDNFIEKETFDAITSETKRFQIGFVGASKTLQDLPEDFRNQLIINVGSLVCFSLAKKDGDALGPTMFRVDGRKKKHETLQNFFNPINTSPQFELISDEEKLNIDRVVGQKERTFFLYRVGSEAGVFHLKSHEFKDIAESHINRKLIAKMHGLAADKEKKPSSASLA